MTNFLEIPIQPTLLEKGLDSFGQSPLRFSGSEINQKAQTMFEAGLPSNFIQDGDTIVRLNVIDGYLQSDGFVTGSSGWRIDSDGNVEFNNGVFRGTLTAASGTLGAITIGTNAWHVDSSGNMWWGSSANYAGATIKISSTGEITFTTGNFSGALSGATGTFAGTVSAGAIIAANINADLINAGTLIGRTVKANDGAGVDCWLESDGTLSFREGGSEKGYLYMSSSTRLLLHSNNELYLDAVNDAYAHSGDNFYLSANEELNLQYNADGGANSFLLYNNTTNVLQFDSSGNMITSANIRCGGTFESSDGSDGINAGSFDVVTLVAYASDIGNYRRTRALTFKDGLLVTYGNESDRIPW